MDLSSIKEYVQKTASIINSITQMQVLICNMDFLIVGDSKDGITNNSELNKLTKNSMLVETIKKRKVLIVNDSKRNFAGCKNCPEKYNCDVNSMITVPIIDEGEVYGAIGIYANEENIDRLLERQKAFLEFIHQMSELLAMKLKEKSETMELEATVKKLKNNGFDFSFDYIVGSSSKIREVKAQAEKFAAGNANILIQGESGTGKEIFARAIHTASGKSNGPFIAINCAALPENLIESELFGYEEGAFTGALKGGKLGKFELANGGTLFLDEIGEFPIHLQAKLLRALQERKVQRLGGNKEIDVSVRIIAATNKDLEQMCKNGHFREDLYYRLSVIPLQIPPLRERKSDIEELAAYFLGTYAKAIDKPIFSFDDDVIRVLNGYSWPGNIRELQNVIEYAVNISSGPCIRVTDLPQKLIGHDTDAQNSLQLKPLKYVEEDYIKEAIRIYGNTLTGKIQAARALGISKATLYRRIKEIQEQGGNI